MRIPIAKAWHPPAHHITINFEIGGDSDDFSTRTLASQYYLNKRGSWKEILEAVSSCDTVTSGSEYIGGGVVRDNLITHNGYSDFADIDVFCFIDDSLTKVIGSLLSKSDHSAVSRIKQVFAEKMSSSIKDHVSDVKSVSRYSPTLPLGGSDDSKTIRDLTGGRAIMTLNLKVCLNTDEFFRLNIICLNSQHPGLNNSLDHIQSFNTHISKCWARLVNGAVQVDALPEAKRDIAKKTITFIYGDWTDTPLSKTQFDKLQVSYISKLIKKEHLKSHQILMSADMVEALTGRR